MALENLENVFQDVSPQNSDIEKNVATKKPVEIEPVFDSVFDDLIKLNPIQIKDPNSPQTKQPDIEITDEKTKKRQEELFQNIGQNNRLGLNDLILEKLYNVNHTAVELGDREPIDIGKYDENGSPILINTLRRGMGDLTKLDIKGYSEGFRVGAFNTPEPYIVQPIGSDRYSTLSNRDFLPLNRALDDTSRLLTFYGSGAGLAFIAKENFTNIIVGNSNQPFRTDKILAPPISNPIQGGLGFLNVTEQFRDLGNQVASLRKPTTIEYSSRKNFGLPFKDLGDKKNIIQRIFTSPYFDLSGGPKDTNYNDVINKSGVEDETVVDLGFTEIAGAPLETDFRIIEGRGDFYVRIKDLRDKSFIYFRGYVTGITENVNPSFTSTNYIGRSEPVYLYERGDRDLSFNLKVYPANNEEFSAMYQKMDKLTSLAYPDYLPEKSNSSLVRMKAPFTELYMAHIGTQQQGQFGFIKSISYTVNESGDWDANTRLPRLFDIAISYQILNKRPPRMFSVNYPARAAINE